MESKVRIRREGKQEMRENERKRKYEQYEGKEIEKEENKQ